MSDKCPHKCVYRNCNGYCKVSVCINPYHNGSGTYKVPTDTYKVPTEWIDMTIDRLKGGGTHE